MSQADKMSDSEAASLAALVALKLTTGVRDENAKYLAQIARNRITGSRRKANSSSAAYAGGRASGKLTRFINAPKIEPTPRSSATLDIRHPALREATTIFPTRVFDASERDHILIPGVNNAKIGKWVTKGPWAGFPIYTVTLEERATCPRSCDHWRTCYGNALAVAVRFRYGPEFIAALEAELTQASVRPVNRKGFVIRLHVLGDFPDIEYVRRWRDWLGMFRPLHVWGYTAHQAGTEIGDAVYALNHLFPGRWAFRNSVAADAPVDEWQASTSWEKPDRVGAAYRAAGGLVCPAETGATAACASCGLCWSPAARTTRITFLGHGMRRK
jgi:hypothetical protein